MYSSILPGFMSSVFFIFNKAWNSMEAVHLHDFYTYNQNRWYFDCPLIPD